MKSRLVEQGGYEGSALGGWFAGRQFKREETVEITSYDTFKRKRHEKKYGDIENPYFEVNYTTSKHQCLLVYAGYDKAVVRGLASDENISFLKGGPVTKVTIIREGGEIMEIEV